MFNFLWACQGDICGGSQRNTLRSEGKKDDVTGKPVTKETFTNALKGVLLFDFVETKKEIKKVIKNED